jgi:hypothetical protein
MGSGLLVQTVGLRVVCDMDKHQQTVVEGNLPLDRMVSEIQGTNVEVEAVHLGKFLEALLLTSGSLASFLLFQPWLVGLTGVVKKSTLQVNDCGVDLFQGRLDSKGELN